MNKQWKVRLLWPHVSHVYCWTFIIYVPWTVHTLGSMPQSSFKLTLCSIGCSAWKYLQFRLQIVTNTTLFWIWWKIYKFQSFYFSMLLFTFSFSKEERWIGYRGWNVTLYFLTDCLGLLKLKFEILKIHLWHEFTTSYFNQKLYSIPQYVQ